MKTVALGNVAAINPRGEKVAPEENISFVGMAQLDAQSATARPLSTRPFRDVSKGYTVFRDDDLLIAKITPCWENQKVGQAKLDKPIGVGSTEFHVVRPGPELHDRYALHFLRQERICRAGELRMTGSGGQRRIPAQFVSELQVPLPPFEEQQRIAAILDRADALRTNRRHALAHLDSLTQSIFHKMFSRTSETSPLRKLGVDFISGKNVIGSFGDSHPINKVIKVSAISSGSFEPGESKPIPLSYVPPKEHRINQGDVLFGRASGSLHLLGATAVVDHDPDQLYLPDKVWKLTIAAESPLTTNYVLGLLRSRSVREFVRHNASGAAGVRNISKSRLLSYEAAVPSSEDQSSFSLRHEQIEKVRLHHQLAIREGARLFASLQSRAFEGEL